MSDLGRSCCHQHSSVAHVATRIARGVTRFRAVCRRAIHRSLGSVTLGALQNIARDRAARCINQWALSGTRFYSLIVRNLPRCWVVVMLGFHCSSEKSPAQSDALCRTWGAVLPSALLGCSCSHSDRARRDTISGNMQTGHPPLVGKCHSGGLAKYRTRSGSPMNQPMGFVRHSLPQSDRTKSSTMLGCGHAGLPLLVN